MLVLAGCDVDHVRQADCPEGAPVLMPGQTTPGVLVNAYYLQEVSARAVRRGEATSPIVTEVLGELASIGVPWVRTNAYNDDPTKIDDSAIQRAPGDLDEVALIGLDRVLAEAHANGIALLLVLTNYWNDYGGVAQYVRWAGLPDPERGDARFFTDLGVRALYFAYIETLLERINTVDGIRYGDHPAVLGWELINEPRGEGLDARGDQMRAWVDDAAAHVHAFTATQAVGIGDEGFDTSSEGYDAPLWTRRRTDDAFERNISFRMNLASPHIDFGTVHLYPEAWRVRRDDIARAGAQWIASHVAVGRALGKPVLIEELGLRRRGGEDLTLDTRRRIYEEWFVCAERTGAAGIGPWLFVNDTRPLEWDPYAFAFHDGTPENAPENEYVDILARFADRFRPR